MLPKETVQRYNFKEKARGITVLHMTAETDKKAKAEDEKSKPRIESEAPAEQPEQVEEVEEPRALRYTTTGAQLRRFWRPD